MRAAGHKIGVLGITLFRPFPIAQVRAALQGAQRVVVLEKSFSVGRSGGDCRRGWLTLGGRTRAAGRGRLSHRRSRQQAKERERGEGANEGAH